MHGEGQPTEIMPPRPRKMHWYIAGIAIVALLLGTVVWYTYRNLHCPVQLAHAEIVIIGRGASLGYVANRLQQRGLIPNALAFRLYAYATHRANKLKLGEYEVTNGMTPADILDLLVSGRARAYSVTIPEGKWASEIGSLLGRHWPGAPDKFSTLVAQPDRWTRQYPWLTGRSLEGYLFPDTYRFAASTPTELIVEKMLGRFQTTCVRAYQQDPPPDGRSLYDVLILASLVEAEAKRDDERARIAGVYYNRLHASPPDPRSMDCDATLIYAKGKRVTRVLTQDKAINSPYNSYRHSGLPPGPINNPGLASFMAALHPESHHYYYYVARGDGSHIFARTLAEQSANIRRVRGN